MAADWGSSTDWDVPKPKGGGGKGKKSRGQKQAERYAASPKAPQDQLIRLAARLNTAKSSKAYSQVSDALGEALQGYSEDEIRRIGRRAELKDSATEGLVRAYASDQEQNPIGRTVGTGLDYVSRPGQAVVSGLAGADAGSPFDFGRAWRGLKGEDRTSPIQAGLEGLAGKSQRDAQDIEGDLPAPVRFVGNTAGAIATDPLTYLTFGTGAGAKAAVRSAAPALAERRGLAVADDLAALGSNSAVQEIADDLTKRGLKALSRDERKFVRTEMGKGVERGIRRAPGGVRVAGHAVPGSVKAQDLFRSLGRRGAQSGIDNPGALTNLERLVSPRAGAKQLARAGDAPAGFAEDIENLASRFTGRARGGAEAGVRRAAHATKGLSDDALMRVQRAMEDPAEAAVLSGREREAFDALDAMRSDVDRIRVDETNMLRTPEELDALGIDALPLERRYPRVLSDEARELYGRGKLPPMAGRADEGGLSPAVIGRVEETKFSPTESIRLPRPGEKFDQNPLRGVLEHPEAGPVRGTDEWLELYNSPGGLAKLANGTADLGNVPAFFNLRNFGGLMAEGPQLPFVDGRLAAVLDEADIARIEARITGAVRDVRGAGPSGTALYDQAMAGYGDAARDAVAEMVGAARDRGYRVFKDDVLEDGSQAWTELDALDAHGLSLDELQSDDLVFVPKDYPGLGKRNSGAPRFELHPGKAMARDFADASRDSARVQFVDELSKITDEAGVPFVKLGPDEGDLASGAWVEKQLPVRNATEDGLTRTQPVIVRKEIADDFDRLTHVLTNDAAKKEWLGHLNDFNNLWKAYATSVFPFGSGFVIRNAEGNLINGFLLGNTNPRYLTTAFKLQRKMAKGVKDAGDALAHLSAAERQSVQEALDAGVLESGFFTNLDDLGKSPTVTSRAHGVARAVNPVSQDFAPLRVGKALNEAVEANARLGMFLGQRAKGLSAPEAARMVRRYLFDYADLTGFDRGMKYAAPFWTWTRKNTPLQLSTLLRTPGKIAGQKHVLDALAHEAVPHEGEDVPLWMLEENGVVMPVKAGGDPLAWVPDLPVTSAQGALDPLTKLVGVAKGEPGGLEALAKSMFGAAGFGGAAGVATSAAQVAAGKDIFSGRPFYPGERVATPVYLQPLQKLGLVGDTIPREMQYLGESAFPAATKVRGALPTDEADRGKQIRRLLSMLTGQTVWPIDDAARRSESFRRVNELDQLRRSLEAQGVKIPDTQRRKSTKGSGGW